MDIGNVIHEGENEFIEFKTSFNAEAMESLVAFANTKGGQVLLGVSNSGKITGVELSEESLQHWINEIKSKTQPSIIPDIEICNIDGKKVVSLGVKEYPVKPISFMGKYFKRKKNSNHQLSPSEISDLYLLTMQYSWDSYPALNHTLDDLDEKSIDKFIRKVNQVGRFTLDESSWADSLTKLKFIINGQPTMPPICFSGKEI